MYVDHKTCGHDSWRKRIKDQRANRNTGEKPSTETPSDAKPAAAPQKLTLNDKLWNAFCTQAVLSAKAVDHIWEDAQGNK